ncbi:MAG: 30S ribosomal protein S27ae [Candidatus Parvarchaeota archaeon]|nr:30S ribosomal protein S27ae [Candidatus Parvarchaeota archaeon]
MPKEKRKNRPSNKIWKLYKIEGSDVKSTHETCPKCGQGVFMAKHKNRLSCGKCGYTVFAGK